MGKRDRGWSDDPRVPVSGEHVAAAVSERNLSVAEIARRIGVPQPTLHYIVAGKTKRCRRSVRDALANELGVLSGWLGGDLESGPFRNRNLRRIQQLPNTTVFPDEFLPEPPPLAQLRATRLIEDIVAAWERDLASGLAPEPPGVLAEVRKEMSGAERRAWLGEYFEGLLISAATFKPHIYQFPEKLTARDQELVEWWRKDDGGFAAAWVDALSRLLRPWLDGHQRLNYPACYEILTRLAEPGRALFLNAEPTAFGRVVKKRVIGESMLTSSRPTAG